MSVTAKQKKQLRVEEASAAYLVEPQKARHSGERRNPEPLSEKWREAKLGEILPLKYGKARAKQFGYPRPRTATFGSNGAFGTFDRALTEKPAIIVGRKGAAGAVHYSPEPCWPIDTAFYTEGSKGIFLPFFRYLLESLQLVRLDRSTAIPSLSRDDYDSKMVRYPEAPAEQRQIVAEIEKQFTRLEAGIAALRRMQANLKRYRAAVLKAACEGRLVPIEAELACKEDRAYESADQLLTRILTERREKWSRRGKYKEPAIPDTTYLPPLPKGWIWASVEQLSTKVVDGVHKKPNYVSSGIPFVTVRNLTAGSGISFKKLNFITPEDHVEFFKRTNPEQGDILVSKDGTLGVIRIIKTDVVFSIFVSVALIKPVIHGMSSFLGAALSSPQVQAQMVPKGSGLQHIHLEDLREDCIPLPPLAEQDRIVSEVERLLSVTEEQEAVVSVNLQRATRLRQAILQQAFQGKFNRL